MAVEQDPVRDHPKICPCDFHMRDIQRDGFCLCTLFGNAQFGREGAQVDVATLLVDNEAIARARQHTIVAYGSHW